MIVSDELKMDRKNKSVPKQRHPNPEDGPDRGSEMMGDGINKQQSIFSNYVVTQTAAQQ